MGNGLQVIVVAVVALALPVVLFYFWRRKILSGSPVYQWALRVESLEKAIRRTLTGAETEVRSRMSGHARQMSHDRAEALKRHLSTLDLNELKQGQGVGPSMLDSLRAAGFRDVGAVASALSLQGVPGIGPEREKVLQQTARRIAESATKNFQQGMGHEAALERTREARATSSLEQSLHPARRTIAACRLALEELAPRIALAGHNGSRLVFSFSQPALLSADTLDAPLPALDTLLSKEVEPVPMPPSQAPLPLPTPPGAKKNDTPAEVDSDDEFLKPQKRVQPTEKAPPRPAPSQPEDPFDPFASEPELPPKARPAPAPTAPAPAAPAPKPAWTQSPGEQLITFFAVMVDLGLAAAKSDGRVVEGERKSLLTTLRERFASEAAVTGHVDIDACLAGREPMELEELRPRLLELRSDQRRWGYRLCCKVVGPAESRNTREGEFLALLRRLLNLKATGSIDPTDPESALELDLEREVTVDGIRRQRNLLLDKYDAEKASGPVETEHFKTRREQVEAATKELLSRLGAPAEAPAPAVTEAPGSRHNPDLDDIFG